MEITETVTLRKFRDFNAKQKQQVCEALLELKETVGEISRKSVRKTLELCLAVLEYKGKQVEELEKTFADLQNERRHYDKKDKLQHVLETLENEKEIYKSKCKELNDANIQFQERLKEMAQKAQQVQASDRDSSDPLSELDKQEKLLQNINQKNKHIKRLVHDIEMLQNENLEKTKQLMLKESELENIKEQILQLSTDITLVDNERKESKQREFEMKIEMTRLEGNVTYLEKEREKQQKEMRMFIEKMEEKTKAWKKALEEKDEELNRLLSKKEINVAKESCTSDSSTATSERTKQRNAAATKLRHLLELRNKHIEKLEQKLKMMAEEMLAATKMLDKLSAKQESENDPTKPRDCCKMIEKNLRLTNERCKQLSELLERTEEDNLLKSKQALHAITALEAFKRGDDGLVPALRKCASLEQKLASRDKQLRVYITELNSMHEIIQENSVLRKRLNIPDDVIVTARNLLAKERNKEKMIERLMLKLRNSEELRLQLKLEKCQLRKELLQLQGNLKKVDTIGAEPQSLNYVSEIGEVPESVPLEQLSQSLPHMCGQCRGQGDGAAANTELQTKYEEVLAENETLRIGMYEILAKLRDYDASSEHITIDTELLKRLIEILPNPNTASNSPQRLQSELLALKKREEALCELVRQQLEPNETGELSSVQSMQDVPELPKEDANDTLIDAVDTSTRPTTPNKISNDFELPVIVDELSNKLEYRNLQQKLTEFQIYRKYYEDLKLHMAADSDELKCIHQELIDKLAKLEIKLQLENNSYTYMRCDYEKLLSASKEQEMRYINETAELKRQLEDYKMKLDQLTNEKMENVKSKMYSEQEFLQLEKHNILLSMQIAHLVEEVLSGKTNALPQLQEISVDYGVIEDDHVLDYITAEEYEQQCTELNNWRNKQAELERKTKQLEGLLEVANGQILSQQKLLNDITDNHINLRHLVADLQSTSEEKLLLAKMQRDLDSAKSEITRIESERTELQFNIVTLQDQLNEANQLVEQKQKDFQNERKTRDVKLKFLKKSLFMLREKYSKFTPLVFLTNFVFAYSKFVQRNEAMLTKPNKNKLSDTIHALLVEKTNDESQQLIQLVKVETQMKLLEETNRVLETKYMELQHELSELRLAQATEMEHWQTVGALFGISQGERQKQTDALVDKSINTEAPVAVARKTVTSNYMDKQTSPIGSPEKTNTPTKTCTKDTQISEIGTQTPDAAVEETRNQEVQSARNIDITETAVQTNGMITLLNQAVQTVETNNEQSSTEVKQVQVALKDANKRIEELEKLYQKSKPESKMDEPVSADNSHTHEAGVIEKTILSLHSLLLEKDSSIKKCQELSQTEREQNQKTVAMLTTENLTLKDTVNNLNFNVKTKDIEILELKAKLDVHTKRRRRKQTGRKNSNATVQHESDENGVNSLNDLTDEKIEQMFDDTSSLEAELLPSMPALAVEGEKEKQDSEELKEIPSLLKQIKEFKDKIIYSEKTLQNKEEEINILKEKVKLYEEREKTESTTNPEIDQLRLILEEKDKHIVDLMETLKSFHDDQKNFMSDTDNYPAGQINKMALDLNRTETTNKIYQAQVDALRRQLIAITQREKQARELNQNLRNQLIKRPVVSIKTELNTRAKCENLQKRIHQLETDLEDTRAQLKHKESLLEAKRTRSANEVGLWEKQKRWQQNAEKFKAKLEETESALAKTRSLLQSARTTIVRLEKDKNMLETKLGKGYNIQTGIKCCRAPSCPNLQHIGAKFTPTPSETPETYTGISSECSSPRHRAQSTNGKPFDVNQPELVEALKARIELQQRKIIAMELEGKGTNALTTELNKLQEHCHGIEAQNLRLEAKNLQLQLDIDMLRQNNDCDDRLKKRIKHLEDYIIALKEEMARLDSQHEFCKCSGIKVSTQQGQPADQAILTLRNIIKKLSAENKYLKDTKQSTESRNSVDLLNQLSLLQKKYADAVQKISSLQDEINTMRSICNCNCGNKNSALNEELTYVKDQLVRKTQLLQKAKTLLTRAAAKEKVLKEQIELWKRKCSELQNVPVIDEISE